MPRPDSSDIAKTPKVESTSNTARRRTTNSVHRTKHTSTTGRHPASTTSRGSSSVSTSQTSSFITSTHSLETAPSSSIFEQSSSSIHWGPATTAHSLPPENTPISHAQAPSESSGFSNGAKKAVISATTIGKAGPSDVKSSLTRLRWRAYSYSPDICISAEAKGRNLFRDSAL